jgi:hypothetical protein
MLVLDRQSAASSQSQSGANNPAGAIERIHLRLRADGRIVELSPGKTTIGSSPRCNVRIQQPGVQPVHCLIVHGPEGLMVRSWARDTRLNGVSFVESTLGLGDCLSIGPVELEVVDPQASAPVAPVAKLPVGESVNRSQLSDGGKLARSRSRKILATLRRERSMQGELRQQISEFEQVVRHVAAERDSASNKLESTMAELNAVRQQLAHKSAAGEKQGKLVEQKQQLSTEQDCFAARIDELTQEKTRAVKDREQILKDIASLNEKHHQQLDEISRLQDELHELKNQQNDACGERDEFRRLNERLHAETLAVSAERASLAGDRAALIVEREEIQKFNEELQESLAQLRDEKPTIAYDHAATAGEREKLERESDELRARAAGLRDENSRLIAEKQLLADERARLENENQRLVELERELRTAVSNRESTSEELYRALLQIAELQEREEQNKALVEVYDTLSSERDQLAQKVDQLREQIERQSDERVAVESAWKSLSDEAAALSDDRQRLMAENAQLLARLNEVAEQLDTDGSSNAAIEAVSAELERERDARAQAEASLELAIADAAAEAERKSAKRSRQLEEAVQMLEQRLANSYEAGQLLEAVRRESELQLDEAKKYAAELSGRVSELESQLALAEKHANQPNVTSASNVPAWDQTSVNAEPQPAPESSSFFDDGAEAVESQNPSEIDWSVRRNSEEQVDGSDNSAAAPEWGTQPAAAQSWGTSFGDEAPADEKPSQWDHSAAVKGQYSDDGLFMSDAQEPTESANLWGSNQSEQSVETSAEDVAFDADIPASESASTPAVWSATQESATQESAMTESPSAQTQPAAKSEATSYIERFAHMFNDDEPAQDQKMTPPAQPSHTGEGLTAKPRTMGIVRPEGQSSPANEQDEESIEQYMAKLLSRVRGDSAGSTSPVVQPPSAPLNAPIAKSPVIEIARTAPLPIPSDEPVAFDTDGTNPLSQLSVNREGVRRKATAAAPGTDLSALRALANETARRAIGRHELRKFRRNAVTKVIVSTLAGVTSLWMMLDSPNWKDIQFITACVSLIVAAIWAGETFRTFAETMRLAASDGPEANEENAGPVSSPALPIDVEREYVASAGSDLIVARSVEE